jgi:hypothetical protein
MANPNFRGEVNPKTSDIKEPFGGEKKEPFGTERKESFGAEKKEPFGEKKDRGFGEKAKEAASHLASQASDVASSVGQRAEDATSSLGSRMQSLAGTLREKTPNEGMMGKASSAVADTLESGGHYLEEQGLRGMAEDVTELIRKNPIPAVLIGIGFGFLLARLTLPRS